MLMHAGFNNLVTSDVTFLRLLAYATLVSLAGLAAIVLTIRRGLEEQHRWIVEKVGDEDRVTHAEVVRVRQLKDADTVLTELTELVGKKKASEVHRFLVLQAQLGILRKALDKLPDEREQGRTRESIEALHEQMDDARRKVGAYTMLTLRSYFPNETSVLWQTLETRLTEGGASGTDTLWLRLNRETEKIAADEIAASGDSPYDRSS
jgi:hypothetical protein